MAGELALGAADTLLPSIRSPAKGTMRITTTKPYSPGYATIHALYSQATGCKNTSAADKYKYNYYSKSILNHTVPEVWINKDADLQRDINLQALTWAAYLSAAETMKRSETDTRSKPRAQRKLT
ncbi:hypothetical protein PoB_007132300 [Plakobranchus ocellatus]|uniref:Uncharacterized protein n=1 Tax=Plakobranchus ocellatus TaxID=259542 RepID=A0AAV4DKN8_9GAST|nr:hypothetical protein PoB_007132300 [Plakobranchus ocellatus]